VPQHCSSSGVPALGANLFVFYFAIISFITPPVALAAYAAAGLANAMRLKQVFSHSDWAFLASLFHFLYLSSSLLILGTGTWETIYALILASGAIVSIAAAFEGWVGFPLKWIERVILVYHHHIIDLHLACTQCDWLDSF